MTSTQQAITRFRQSAAQIERDVRLSELTDEEIAALLSAACELGEDAVERLREALSRVITSARFEWLGRDVCNSVHAALAQPVQESKA